MQFNCPLNGQSPVCANGQSYISFVFEIDIDAISFEFRWIAIHCKSMLPFDAIKFLSRRKWFYLYAENLRGTYWGMSFVRNEWIDKIEIYEWEKSRIYNEMVCKEFYGHLFNRSHSPCQCWHCLFPMLYFCRTMSQLIRRFGQLSHIVTRCTDGWSQTRAN